MRLFYALLSLAAFAGTAAAEIDIKDLRASIVSVDVVAQEENYWAPWLRPNPQGFGGSAFYIGDHRLMTNAHVVSNAKIIRLKRPDNPEKFEARVLFYAHDCDLALLTVDDERFFDGMIPLSFGDVPKLRSQVTTVGYPVGGRKLSITQGVVSRIELHNYVHTGVDRHLTVQTDAAINPGNSGGPVIQGDKVVGVAFQTRFFEQNIGYMIPTPVIRHMLKDVEDGKYDGYPLLGIRTGTLENDALRAWLEVPEGESGVVVLKTLPFSSAEGLLKRDDVIHRIDEYKVENDGTVKVGDEFLELTFVIQEKYVGDTIHLKVRRDGKLLDVPVTLKKWDVMMKPATIYGGRPEYLVLGGYVFVPLTRNYANRSGWRTALHTWLDEFYWSKIDDWPGVDQLVILSRVLRHDSTRYRNYSNAVVRTVNGKMPRDFADFVRMLERNEVSRIEFEGMDIEPLILNRERIRSVHREILEQYGIKEDRHLKGGE